MKLTRRKLRQLIFEAITKRQIFPDPNNPITRDELAQIRAQSRVRAGIPAPYQEKIGSIEITGDEESINQARDLAKTLGSERGEITAQQEDDFFRALDTHEMLPPFESILGNTVYDMNFDLLKKIYHSTQLPSDYEVWINTKDDDEAQPDEEPYDVILEKFKKGDYGIHSFGTVKYTGDATITHRDLTDFQKELSRLLPLPPDYYIFKLIKHLRPDINIWF